MRSRAEFALATTRSIAILVALAAALAPASASHARAGIEETLDRADRALAYGSAGGDLRLEASGMLDVEAYYIDEEPPGVIFEDDESLFVQPRLTVFLDAFAGKSVYGFVQARVDRGFDAGLQDPDARLDEYFLRWSPLSDERLAVQMGKFATVVGNFVDRHHSWDNPFVNAPLPYENITTISDNAPPPSRDAFLGRRDIPDRKRIWVPIVWGPAYTSGVAVLGTISKLTYAIDMKNAAVSSRPPVWDNHGKRWKNPTFSARLGYAATAALALGASASRGAYLRPDSDPLLGPGRDVGDFPQTTIAGDLAYAARRWRAWAEVFASRFDVPGIGNLDTLAYYVEWKHEPAGRWWTALRWNQQVFEEISDGAGGHVTWDRDVWRADASVGMRFTRHTQAKLQYGFTERDGSQEQGQQFVAVQVTARF